jgi:multiple sugar transport system permease protein
MTAASLPQRLQSVFNRRFVGPIFLAPALVLFAFFSWNPIVQSFIIAFQEPSMRHDIPPKFVGFQNFTVLFDDPRFYQSWYNIFIFVVLALLIGYLVPVILAIAINEMRHLKAYLRLGYYLPVIIPLVVVAILWKYVYAPDEGLLDSLLQVVGFHPVRWLINGKTAMLSLVIMATWKGAGGAMIIYLAALQGVPQQLYEAAEIDGASIWQRIRSITLPHILPVMFILFILQIIGTAQLFVEPFIMTQGGPAYKTYSVLMYIYDAAFRYYDYGVAAAMGLILFMVLVALTIVYFAIQRRFYRG